MGVFTPKELEKKAKRFALQVLRAKKGKPDKHDQLPGDPEQAKEFLRPLYFPNEFDILCQHFDLYWQMINVEVPDEPSSKLKTCVDCGNLFDPDAQGDPADKRCQECIDKDAPKPKKTKKKAIANGKRGRTAKK